MKKLIQNHKVHYWLCITGLFCLLTATVKLSAQSLMHIKSWAYQLDSLNIADITNNETFEMMVMDYSQDGTIDGEFTATQIAQIKSSGKLAIAYVSLGEAQDFRYYWNPSWSSFPPSWLGPEDPDQPGNYKVRFWNATWKNIMLSYLSKVSDQGFDGIYLDHIDVYEYWMNENPEEPFADTLMIDFVKDLRTQINNTISGNFYIIPQNGEFIINSTNVSLALRNDYLGAINGLAAEGLYFGGDLLNDNPLNIDQARIDQLGIYLANGKRVFAVEYLTIPFAETLFIGGACVSNFVPYITVGTLDTLQDGHTLPVKVQLNVFLEGPYRASTGLMSTGLKNSNLIPLEQPFYRTPWWYNGGESVESYDFMLPNIVDWVLVEARPFYNKNIITEQRAGWLLDDGTVVDIDRSPWLKFYKLVSNQSYYLSVKTRNHIGVLANAPIQLPNEIPFYFSDVNNVDGGANQLADLGGLYGMLAGDFNSDGVISIADFNDYFVWTSYLNVYKDEDGNMDKSVTISDFNLYQANTSKIGVLQVRY